MRAQELVPAPIGAIAMLALALLNLCAGVHDAEAAGLNKDVHWVGASVHATLWH